VKKRLIVVAGAVLIVVCGLFAVYRHIENSPELALIQTVSDIKSDGIDGLTAHLTDDANEKVSPFIKAAKSKLANSVIPLLASNSRDYQRLIDNIEKIEWDIGKSKLDGTSAEVQIKFRYGNDFSGCLRVNMKKEGDDWKIDGISIEQFVLRISNNK